jgi:hypothetical protein
LRVKIVLADSAEVREGLLFLLGGGWNHVGPQPQPFAIAGLVEVDWNETNSRHRIEFVIEDEDGSPFLVPTPTGDQPFRLGSEFDVGRPAGATQGETFNLPIAVPITPLPWNPGRRYVVRTLIDGNEMDRLTFQVRAAPPRR